MSRLIGRVIQRADEITEMLAFYAQANERDGAKQLNRLSKQVQKGIVMAFNKFDAFQFAKYDRDGAAVKLRDALFLTHPVAKDAAQQAIFNQIATGTLETPYTWETELSALGQQKFANEAEKKAAFRVWRYLESDLVARTECFVECTGILPSRRRSGIQHEWVFGDRRFIETPGSCG